jgi:hypothetical protein
MASFADQVSNASLGDSRARTTYTIPEELRDASKRPETVSLRLLTSDEELQASRAGKFDIMKSQYEATKLMIVALDGKPVSVADGSVDSFWERADPRVRNLLIEAYNRLSSPTRGQQDDFFKSARIEV